VIHPQTRRYSHGCEEEDRQEGREEDGEEGRQEDQEALVSRSCNDKEAGAHRAGFFVSVGRSVG
jgi:hypothetical protein